MGLEKSNVNPSASWIELESDNDIIVIKIANSDYFLKSHVKNYSENTDSIHATIDSNTFVNIVAKLDVEDIEIHVENNALILTTKNNQYTFPIIKENGVDFVLKEIDFSIENEKNLTLTGKDLESVADSNAQGFVDATFSKEIQQYIFVDNIGALTFTDNIYINNFNAPSEVEFSALLNVMQAKLLKMFSSSEVVNVTVGDSVPSGVKKIKLVSESPNIVLVLNTQSQQTVNQFPAEKIRSLSVGSDNTHVVLNKSKLEKALNRLMVFDKKFDITVLDYSKFVFEKNKVKLISVKNHNFEILEYDFPCENVDEDFQYNAIIRFADMLNQLKAIQSESIDVSFGNGKAIVINSTIKQIIPEIKPRTK